MHRHKLPRNVRFQTFAPFLIIHTRLMRFALIDLCTFHMDINITKIITTK